MDTACQFDIGERPIVLQFVKYSSIYFVKRHKTEFYAKKYDFSRSFQQPVWRAFFYTLGHEHE